MQRDRRGSHPRRRGGDDQRPGALDDPPRPRRPRGLGRHAGHGRRRDLRQRALRRPADRRSGHRGAARVARRRDRAMSPAAAMAFGYDRSRLQDTRRGAAVGGLPRVAPAIRRRCARRRAQSLAFRKRTQPLDTPSAGCIFQNPEPGRDAVPDGIPWSAGALVDRAGLKGAADRRRPRLADARQLHRQRRHGDGRGHPRADRALPDDGSRALRRRAARGDRLSRRLRVMTRTRTLNDPNHEPRTYSCPHC